MAIHNSLTQVQSQLRNYLSISSELLGLCFYFFLIFCFGAVR